MKNYLKFVVGFVLSVAAGSVFAAVVVPPSFDSLTANVDVSTMGTAILAISALSALPLVIRKGARMVLGSIR